MLKAKIDTEAVLVGAATPREARLTCEVLGRAGVQAEACGDIDALCGKLREGAGAALLSEEILTWPALRQLREVIAKQEAWSDFPLVIFRGKDTDGRRIPDDVQALGNVTLLDRPVRTVTLVSTMQSALRARRRQYEAKRAIEARDQFLVLLGHEMRNPIGAIYLAAQVMKRAGAGGLGDKLERQRATIERQARTLSRLVDDLLDVVRVVSGKVTLEKEPLELNQLVRRCIKLTELAMTSKSMSWFFSPALEPLVIEGDAVRLDQVFTNLLTNAVKYSPPGTTIDVTVQRESNDALIRVRDAGAGIPRGMLESIFELFTQVDPSKPSAQGGFGLGLALVRQIVEQHGGKVVALSEGLGAGSEFQVRLPLSARVAISAVPDEPVEAPSQRPMRVLVVEDCEDTRDSLRELLAEFGHNVAVVGDGEAGVEAANDADVVLIDIGLPGDLDGLEVARRIRAHGRPITLVAVTGYAHHDFRQRALEAGFDAHLPKPMDIDELNGLLRRAASYGIGSAAAVEQR
jgi:signal transduction histidine kinase/ActR/RegA family two-component response regulator